MNKLETGRIEERPAVAILMAVYEPNMEWFREQLQSLNEQTYPNLRLYIRDDCSPTIDFNIIRQTVEECVSRIPYSIKRNNSNIGSNGTFELLTKEAEGDLFAYCDQDDVWLPEKLTVLERVLTSEKAELVCSDMYIVDTKGKQTADSLSQVRKNFQLHSGENLSAALIVDNWVTGCTMLVKAETAKAAVPFCPYLLHDQYIALRAAEKGKIVSLPDRLIRYRIHGNNQSQAFAGISDKQSYMEKRIDLMINRMQWLRTNFPCSDQTKKEIENYLSWAEARKKCWIHKGGIGTVLKFKKYGVLTSLLEPFLSFVPDTMFCFALKTRNRKTTHERV